MPGSEGRYAQPLAAAGFFLLVVVVVLVLPARKAIEHGDEDEDEDDKSVQGGIIRSNCQQMIGGSKIFHDVKPGPVIRRINQNRFGRRMDNPRALLELGFELSACPTGISDERPDQFRTASSHDLHLL